MDLVVKSSVLVVITLISFVISQGFWTLCFLESNNLNIRMISEHLLGIDSIINCTCLCLLYTYMEKHYYAMCNICHESCWKKCHQSKSKSVRDLNRICKRNSRNSRNRKNNVDNVSCIDKINHIPPITNTSIQSIEILGCDQSG